MSEHPFSTKNFSHPYERLDYFTQVDPVAGCWIYTGRLDVHGYGPVWDGARVSSAHRIAFERSFGPIPKGHHVHHMCHTRACINPSHLTAIAPSDHSKSHNSRRKYHGPCRTCGSDRVFRDKHGKRKCRACRNARKKARPIYGPPTPRPPQEKNEGPCRSCGETDFYRNAQGKRKCRVCRRARKAANRRS